IVKLLNATTGDVIGRLGEPAAAVTALAWNAAGDRLAVARKGGIVEIWDAKEPRLLRTLPSSGSLDVRALAWSSDGSLAAAGGAEAWMWNHEGERVVFAPPPVSGQREQVTHLAWSPDGSELALGGWMGRVFLVPRHRSESRRVFSAGEGTELGGLAWSPDG